MRRRTLALLSLALLACQGAPNRADERQPAPAKPEAPAKQTPSEAPAELRPVAVIEAPVRKDLLAEELPPAPTLAQLSATQLGAGELALPEGREQVTPRAAVAVRDGLLLVGQAYGPRVPGQPPDSVRWIGLAPASGEPRTSLGEAGAIRAAIAHDGGALLAGTRGVGFEVRGWVAIVGPDGAITREAVLDTPNSTELFDLAPGRAAGELAVAAGYVDAQGWLISLDAELGKRWEKYIGSYGATQARALARLDDGDLLTVGARAKEFGELWTGKAPGDGGESAAPDDVEQAAVELDADPNRMLRAIVDLGEPGYLALGTAKLNHVQAHDQVVLVGFDRSGEQTSARVVPEVRVTDVVGARASEAGAQFLVLVPLAEGRPAPVATAVITVSADPQAPVSAARLTDEGWVSAGFIEGASGAELLTYATGPGALQWRRLSLGE